MRRADALVTSPGNLPVSAAQLRGRLIDHVRLPLHRDAYALALNSAFTAAAGLLYWIVAAKTYPDHAVGVNSALISAMTFLSGIASLNLPNILVRFLPESGDRTRQRVSWSYGVSAALAAGAAVVFVVGVGAWTPRLNFLRSDHGLQAWFVFSTIAWCLFTIQDSVLTALGRAVWVPVENAVFSLLKLGLLAVLAVTLRDYGIFVSWTIAMLVSVAGVNLLVFTRLMRRTRQRPRRPVEVRNRAFAHYFVADYSCSVAWLAIINLTPLIVTAAAGATMNAFWALAFTVAYPLYLISQNIGTSLMLHGTNNGAALPVLVRKAAIQGARVLIPSVTLLVLLAPYLLSLFGQEYHHHSTTALRLLAIGVLPNFVVMLAVYVARVQRRLRRAVIALCTDALVTLGLATPLIHAMGVNGVALGWTCAQVVVALGLLCTWRSSFAVDGGAVAQGAPRPVWVSERRISRNPAGAGQGLAGAEQGVGTAVTRADAGGPSCADGDERHSPEAVHPVLSALFSALEGRGLRWTLLRVPSNLAAPAGDVDILVAPEEALALREVAGELGFVPLPGWEAAPDLILLCYDRPSDRWLVLDVSTSVSFRSPRSWRLPAATDQVLGRRELNGAMAVPADADLFWLVLLHCLLDKGRVASHHRATLRRLAPVALDSPLGPSLCAAAGWKFTPRDFVAAARSLEDDALEPLGAPLVTALRRHRPLRERALVLLRAGIRVARKPFLVRRRRGLSLALLGPNGVGKSTAAISLQRSLPFDVRIVYMGMWKRTKHRGKLGTVLEIAFRPLRIWLRYLVAYQHQLRGRIVVFDRYVYDALLPPTPPLLRTKRAYFLFLAHALPRPGATVFLDVPGAVAYDRKHESRPQVLESERRLYAELTKRSISVELIDAAAAADAVRAELTTILWRQLACRWQGAYAQV
jgi:O-antigen/teichoic acid export membrane protein